MTLGKLLPCKIGYRLQIAGFALSEDMSIAEERVGLKGME
jgi:hypothetical protein